MVPIMSRVLILFMIAVPAWQLAAAPIMGWQATAYTLAAAAVLGGWSIA